MTDATRIESAIRAVRDQQSFIQTLLGDALGWPIDGSVGSIDELGYEWTTEELRLGGFESSLVEGRAFQIVLPGNPWGIFILEFENPDVFITGRGMTGVLRRMLQSLALKKRATGGARLASFRRENLLFICNHNYESYRFAHFRPPAADGTSAPMTSFGWGPGDASAVRTICEFNLAALSWPEDELTSFEWTRRWESAFDVERVTQQFYRDYAAVFERTEALIDVSSAVTPAQRRLFTQSLFNRLMFIRFLERKGWLSLPGQTDTNYLGFLSSAPRPASASLYRSRICPLFFDGLAGGKPTSSPTEFGAVPPLNGGLFEKSRVDDLVRDVPDDALDAIISPTGLFYRYNFTVEESTPLNVEVAVDPEMLGKVFEELVTGRHQSGSYYTPREVVSYMAGEVLKRLLVSRTSASAASIESLVDGLVINELTDAQAFEIQAVLSDLKVIDPACGSGAYLLGVLHKLVALRRVLLNEKLSVDPAFLYKTKLEIISRNLYGVDIDPFATEIAKLRLWLSLAVDAEAPLPLPNLDFKIETGDSLLGNCSGVNADLFDSARKDRAHALLKLKAEFLTASSDRKAELKKLICRQEAEFSEELRHLQGTGAIDWQVQFAEVFANDGFDVVLANPPYVSALEFAKTRAESERTRLKEQFETTKGAWDLYVPFFERGVQLLRPGGELALISPNKYLSASYAVALRGYMRTHASLTQLVDLSRFPVFAKVAVYPVLSFFTKAVGRATTVRSRLPNSMGEAMDPSEFRIAEVPDDTLDLLPDHIWGFLLSDKIDLLTRLMRGTVPLSVVADVSATTTAAEADEYGRYLVEGGAERGRVRVVNTGTIDPYRSKWGDEDLTHQGERYRKPLIPIARVSEKRRKLYGSRKVLFAKLARRCEAFLDDSGHYGGLNVNCISNPRKDVSLEFLCAYLNSRVFMFLYNQFFGALRMNGGYYQFQSPQMRAVPVRLVSEEQQGAITAEVQNLIKLDLAEDPAGRLVMERLDKAFARIFGLTERELSCITPEGDWVAP